MSGIRVNRQVTIDEDEVHFDFIRASGPGGQNVNKVSTAVRLRFDVRGTASLPEEVRERLIRLAGKKVGDDGFLSIHARRCRTQESNRRDAIDRLVELVERLPATPAAPGHQADGRLARAAAGRQASPRRNEGGAARSRSKRRLEELTTEGTRLHENRLLDRDPRANLQGL